MVFRQDILIQQIERLAQAFSQIVASRKAEQENRAVLEDALADVLRTRRELLWSLGDETWELLDPTIAAEVSRLFALHAVISKNEGSAKQALDVAKYGLGVELRNADETLAAHILERLREFSEQRMVAERLGPMLEDLFDHFVEHQQWALAEDVLFDRLAMPDADVVHTKGIKLFERLTREDEEVLIAGGLTHDEVVETLDELGEWSS